MDTPSGVAPRVRDRSRLFNLLIAIEEDLRELTRSHLVPYLDSKSLFGSRLQELRQRAEQASSGELLDPSDPDQLVGFLDFADSFGLLNSHETLLPDRLAKEIGRLNPKLTLLPAVRNRVVHARPLHEDDASRVHETCYLLLDSTLSLPRLRAMHGLMASDPEWTPGVPEYTPGAGGVIHNLPIPDFDETGLLGREKEVHRLARDIRNERFSVITVLGEGGVGKTALVTQVLYDLIDDPECPFEAVLWTSLKSEYLTGGGVRRIENATNNLAQAIAELAAPIEEIDEGGMNELGQILQDIPTLIVIDNLETIDGQEVVGLIEEMPESVKFLFTSRIGLGQLERQVKTEALSETDASRLLSDFAEARGVSQVSGLTKPQLRAIAERLRLTPLGIRWFVEAVATGREAEEVLAQQEDLLSFCVDVIWTSLDEETVLVAEALAISSDPRALPELVFVSELSNDDVRRAIQRLISHSLLDATLPSSDPQNSAIGQNRYALSQVARAYISHLPALGTDQKIQLANRYRELSKEFVRHRNEWDQTNVFPGKVDVPQQSLIPVARLLRDAFSESANGDFGKARELIDRAAGQAPTFYEVHRMKAFIFQDFEPQETLDSYEEGLSFAENELERARVAYFFAGFLMYRDEHRERAIALAREADETIGSVETGTRLARALMFNDEIEPALERIGVALEALNLAPAGQSDKSARITISLWLHLNKRLMERAGTPQLGTNEAAALAEKTSLQSHDYANRFGYDQQLVGAFQEFTAECLYAVRRLEVNVRVAMAPAIGSLLETLANSKSLGQGSISERAQAEIARFAADNSSDGLSKLRSLASELFPWIVNSTGPPTRRTGYVYSFFAEKGYGFIIPEREEEAIFFHIGDAKTESPEEIHSGMPASFIIRTGSEGKPEAAEIEISRDHEELRSGLVHSFFQDKGYGFISPEGEETSIFFHISNTHDFEQPSEIQEGTAVLFKTGLGKGGKPQALGVQPATSPQS
jgi:cold shock CspA family protein